MLLPKINRLLALSVSALTTKPRH